MIRKIDSNKFSLTILKVTTFSRIRQAALFKIIKTDQDGTVSAIYLGIVLTIVLAIIGLIISKR